MLIELLSESAALLGDPDFPRILDPAKHGERILRFQELYQQYSRLDLSADYDRPAAIDSLQQRLRNTMNVEGEWGVLDDRTNQGLLRRSLLWCRGSDTNRLNRIIFPSSRKPAPSWSWMAFSGGIDYFVLKWSAYQWIDIKSPWSRTEDAVDSNVFIGKAKTLIYSVAETSEHKIVFDDPTSSGAQGYMAIVLGIEKTPKDIADKRHYILVVRLDVDAATNFDSVYERVGAGYVPGRYLVGEATNCVLG
jgi:hypothetical protein